MSNSSGAGAPPLEPAAEAPAASHTPGPWHFVEDNAGLMMDHGYGILYGEPDSWGWEKNLYVSVGCSNRVAHELGRGVAEANARLIAAAPDLLDALKGVVTILEAVKFTVGLRGNQLTRLEKARAALSKAGA